MIKFKSSSLIMAAALFLSPAAVLGADKTLSEKMPAPKVDVYKMPTPKDISINLTYPAIINPYQEVCVVARVSGTLKEKFFKEGEFVQKDALLYKIEDSIYKAKYEAQKANLAIARAELDNAAKDWERNQRLYKSKSISDEKRDTSLFNYEQAKAKIALAQANLEQAKIDYEYTNVKAPIAGYTGLQKADIGDFVTQTPPQGLLTLTQNRKLYVEFSIPSKDYDRLKNKVWTSKNEQISLNIIANGIDTKVTGNVDFIDVNVDKATSTVKMRAVVDNSAETLSAGSFVRVKLNGIIQKNTVMIPQKALLQSAQGTIVFVAVEGKVQVRPVAIGDEVGDKYTLTWSKLQPGDKVIVNNFFRAKPMQEVIVDKIINQNDQDDQSGK